MSISQVKLGTKLIGGFCFVLALLVSVALLATTRLGLVNGYLYEIGHANYAKVKAATDMMENVNGVALAVRNISLSFDKGFKESEKKKVDEFRSKYKEALERLSKLVSTEKEKQLLAPIKETGEAINPLADKAVALGMDSNGMEVAEVMKEMDPAQKKFIAQINAMINFQDELTQKTIEAGGGAYASARLFMIALSGIAIAAGMFIAFFLARSITHPIHRVVKGLREGSEQVATGSAQVATASHALAEGASEQAAGIEETSSSVEEMSSMTRQNAENANQANTMMAETSRVVDEANHSMMELTQSMKEISAASEETAKIIKTVDEIAFQTNLLALNAAVEAARAGEAGAGFAVVSDEVRNLAMRAAEAAKNTADLIEGTVKKIKHGSDTVAKTNEAFAKVASGAKKIGALVEEISAASMYQAKGIDQINKAVLEMDKVVQKNASSAEESASAAMEMSDQAEKMKAFVQELIAVIGGNGGGHEVALGTAAGEEGEPVVSRQENQGVQKVPQTEGKKRFAKGASNKPGTSHSGKLDPEQVIPMNPADFKEF